MASRAAKTRAHKRDRRKAKASGYARPGKTNMGTRIGHGSHGVGHASFLVGRFDRIKHGKRKEQRAQAAEKTRARPSRLVSLGSLLKRGRADV